MKATAKLLGFIMVISACGKSNSTNENKSPEPTAEASPVPDAEVSPTPQLPVATPNPESAYFGSIVGCVSSIAPEDPENIEATSWNINVGCSSAVIEAQGTADLDNLMQKKAEEKCPNVVFHVTAIGRNIYKCSMSPNPPFFFSSNSKSEVEKYIHGGTNCTTKIAQMSFPDVTCVKQRSE